MNINRLVTITRASTGEHLQSLSDMVPIEAAIDALVGVPDDERDLAERKLRVGHDYRFSIRVCGFILAGRLVPMHLPPLPANTRRADLRRKELAK